MAVQKWPPETWTNIVDPNAWPDFPGKDFLVQTIPLMDLFQWGYEFSDKVIDALPHQPPVFTRPVIGTMSFFANGAKITSTIPVGSVGYNAITRQVIWSVNEYGGFQKNEATFDIPMMIPILMQLLRMVPWSVVGEFGSSAKELGQNVYEWVREALREWDVALPALLISDKAAQQTNGSIILQSGTYSFDHGSFTYTFFIPKDDDGLDIVLPVDGVTSFNATSTSVGIDTVYSGDEISVDYGLKAGQKAKTTFGRKHIKGTDFIASTASRMILRVTNTNTTQCILNFTHPLIYQDGTHGIIYNARFEEYPEDTIDVNTIILEQGESTHLILDAQTNGRDARWRNANTAVLARFNQAFPQGSSGVWVSNTASFTAVNGINEYSGTQNVVQIIVKNESHGLSLIPNWADILSYLTQSIPLMDLCQVVYDGLQEMVDAIYHHPPNFQKTVWTGGVLVKYLYYVHETWQNKEDGVVYNDMPPPAILKGKTLSIAASFSSGAWDSLGGTSFGAPLGERVLLTHTFPTWHASIRYIESNATYNEKRGDAQVTSIVFLSAYNSGDVTLPLRAGTYQVTLNSNEFRCTLDKTIILENGAGTLLRFEAIVAGAFTVTTGAATVVQLDGELDSDITWKAWTNDTSNVSAVGRVGLICSNPFTHIDVEAQDIIKPHTSFLASFIAATWEVKTISHGTNYIPAIPATPKTDQKGDILFSDATNAAFTHADGQEEVIARPCEVTIDVKTFFSDNQNEVFSYTPGSSFQLQKAFASFASEDGVPVARLSSVEKSETGVTEGDTFTISVGTDILTGYVITVLKKGVQGPPGTSAVGSAQGEEALLEVILVNETDTAIDLNSFFTQYKKNTPDIFERLITVNGEDFIASFDGVSGVLPASSGPNASSIRFDAVNTNPILFSTKEVLEVNASFASTCTFSPQTPMASWALRWRKDKDAVFIGDWIGTGSGVSANDFQQQYLFCRLGFKHKVAGGTIEPFYTYVYTGDASSNDYSKTLALKMKVPKGSVPIAMLQYNAKEKSISVQNLRNGGIVKMKVNACVWFIIKHISLIPLQVV